MGKIKKNKYQKIMDKYYRKLDVKRILDFIFQGTQYSSRYIHEYVDKFKEDKRTGKLK
jgi:hypothetical protein